MGKLMYLPVDMIYPNPRNPRKNFDPDAMAELVSSVRQVGILQPVVVVLSQEDNDSCSIRYRLVAGERRWRAAKAAELTAMPVVIRDLTPEQELEVMIIENLQRRDVDPIEEAQGMKALLDEGRYTQEALADKLSCSQGHIANRLRLLRLPDELQQNISRKIISAGHANALLKLEKTPAMMKKAAAAIAEKQVPVAKAADAIAKVVAEEGKPLFNDDYNNKPEFKTEQCEKCEFRVMGNQYGYGDGKPYCIKPSCWEKNQQEVKQDRERALADRVQKLAKKGQGVIELSKFSYDQYEEFLEYKTKDMDLTECEGCEHRKVAKNSYRDELTEACFQPSCFKKKQAAVAREKNKAARSAYQIECERITKLAVAAAGTCQGTNIARQVLAYLAAQILVNINGYDGRKTRYQYVKDKFGWKDEYFKNSSYQALNSDWDKFGARLETLTEGQLWEIIFEWPAVAEGLKGAAGWVLQQVPHPKHNAPQEVSKYEFKQAMADGAESA